MERGAACKGRSLSAQCPLLVRHHCPDLAFSATVHPLCCWRQLVDLGVAWPLRCLLCAHDGCPCSPECNRETQLLTWIMLAITGRCCRQSTARLQSSRRNNDDLQQMPKSQFRILPLSCDLVCKCHLQGLETCSECGLLVHGSRLASPSTLPLCV